MSSNGVDSNLLKILDDHGHEGANGASRTVANTKAARLIQAWADQRTAAVLERLDRNGAVIHDCGKRVDNVVHQSSIRAELAALSPKTEQEKS